ncbi:MAG: alpha/beta fold hydrolase, partial [Pseudomonadota bacterium]
MAESSVSSARGVIPLLRWIVLAAGLAVALTALLQIEGHRPDGVDVTRGLVGTTPITEWRQDNAIATVIVAHGFAGSRQLMNAFSWTLARNGYDVLAFDFQGHGTNPTPMSGDTDSIEGTTKLLVDETVAIMDTVGPSPALLQIEGHRPDGVDVTRGLVGTTPITEWRQDNAIATVIV